MLGVRKWPRPWGDHYLASERCSYTQLGRVKSCYKLWLEFGVRLMAGLDIKGLSISIQSSLHVPVPAPHHFINNIQISDIMRLTTDTPSQASQPWWHYSRSVLRKNFESSDKNIYILIPSGVGLPIRKELADRGFLQCNIRSTDYKEEVSEEVSHSSIKLLYSLLPVS